MAKVKRKHREAAYLALYAYSPGANADVQMWLDSGLGVLNPLALKTFEPIERVAQGYADWFDQGVAHEASEQRSRDEYRRVMSVS